MEGELIHALRGAIAMLETVSVEDTNSDADQENAQAEWDADVRRFREVLAKAEAA